MAANPPDVDALIQAVIAAANAAAAAAGPPAIQVPPIAPPALFALLPGAAYNALQTTVQDRRSSNRNKKVRPEDAWKKIAPKSGEPTTKEINGKTYNYCVWHKAWCIHTAAKCDLRLKGAAENSAEVDKVNTEEDKLVINRAYHAIIHGYEDDEE
jgi:hypothetical protein